MIRLERFRFQDLVPGQPLPLAYSLHADVERAIAEQRPLLLYLNRLGIAKETECRDCHERFPWQEAPESCPKCGGVAFRMVRVGLDGLAQQIATAWPSVPVNLVTADRALPSDVASSAPNGITLATSHLFSLGDLWTQAFSLVIALGIDGMLAQPHPSSALSVVQLLTELGERFVAANGRLAVMTHDVERPLFDAVVDVKRRQQWYENEWTTLQSMPGLHRQRMITLETEDRKADERLRALVPTLPTPPLITSAGWQGRVYRAELMTMAPIAELSPLQTLPGHWRIVLQPTW